MMVALFLLSVVAIVLAVDLVVGVIYLFTDDAPVAPGLAGVPGEVFATGAVVTVAIIAVVSLWNIVGLAGGGAKVARMLGGRKVAADTRDALERRFVNIVEEMAILDVSGARKEVIAGTINLPLAWPSGRKSFAAEYRPTRRGNANTSDGSQLGSPQPQCLLES